MLPDEMERRREIEARMRARARLYGFREIATPVFEELELFTIRSGEGIINEMYVFEDKGGRSLALRPELTAPASGCTWKKDGPLINRSDGATSLTVSGMNGHKKEGTVSSGNLVQNLSGQTLPWGMQRSSSLVTIS